MSGGRNIFSIALKSIRFAWVTNKRLFFFLIILNAFQGAVVYLQFTSFSSIVDEIFKIKQGLANYDGLMRSSVTLGLAFIIPTLVSNLVNYLRAKFRLDLDMQLDLHKIDKQSELDIGVIESNSYQTLLRSAQEWGTSSMLSLQDFIFSSATSFAGIITSLLILWSLNYWLVLISCLWNY